MAQRFVTLSAAVLLAGVVIIPVGAVLWRGGGFGSLGPGDYAALRFTLWQAAVSAGLSVLLAIPVARALARSAFPGRSMVIILMGAPFILPVIVAILGLLAVFGGGGMINRVAVPLGLPRLDIYGYHGVILAHVFFNLPLAVRLILQGWNDIPAERFRLAQSLGVPTWRVLEWPMLSRLCPAIFAMIFVICLGTFSVALTLGGGPRATTVELAIYQAFHFDFDLAKAATLANVQLGLGLIAGAVALWIAPKTGFGAGLDRLQGHGRYRMMWQRIMDGLWIAAAALFLLLPLMSVLLAGVFNMALLPMEVWQAALRSLILALGTTALTLTLAIPLLTRVGEAFAVLGISVSGLVLGTGVFLILQPFVRPADMALPITMLVNALMALPFVIRILRPSLEDARAHYHRLGQALGLRPWQFWAVIYAPRLIRPLGFAAGLIAALSMGDLGVIALFADGDSATLPLQIYRLMGSYQMEAAQGAAALLLCLSLGLFWLFDQMGRWIA